MIYSIDCRAPTPNKRQVESSCKAIPNLPLWKRISPAALRAFSTLGKGSISCIKDGREISVTFSFDRSLAIKKAKSLSIPQVLKTSFDQAPVNPYPIYSEIDEFHIHDLLTTLDEASILSLGVTMFHLAEIGDRIAHLHPMTFMKVVFNNPALRSRLKRSFNSSLKRLGMMNGTYFRKGFNHQLDRESKRGTLEPNIDAFALSLGVNAEEIRPLFRSRAWMDLYYYLLEKTSVREG